MFIVGKYKMHITYLCQMKVENGLTFIIVNIEDSVIHSSHL
jgi:hypothetical protein